MKKAFTLVALGLIGLAALSADARGDQIAAQYFGLTKPADTSANAVMTLIDKSGGRKVRNLDLYSKSDSTGDYSFSEFKTPADVAGTKFLTTPLKDGTNEQRLYLPALKKTRKIASSDKSGEFVNSDLWYYDLESRKLSDNTYTFLSDNEVIADKAFAGMKFFKVEVTAKSSDCPYSKSIFWINMDDSHAYKIEAYDKDGALLKTILFVKFEEQKGLKVPVQTAVTNHKKGTKTLLQLNNLKVNSGLKDEVFSVKNLEQ